MTVTTNEWASTNRAVAAPTPGGLAEVVDLILDKGLVIDIFVRVSLLGIELLTIDARIVIASVDTYLRYAEAVGRLDLEQRRGPGLPDLLEHAGPAGGLAKAAKAGGVAETAGKAVGGLVERGAEKVGQLAGNNGEADHGQAR